jgi:mono/diheme cytochrome c family protein
VHMTRLLPAAAILAIAAALGAGPLQAQNTAAAGTAAQAAAGAKLYAADCSACHGATLKGGSWPALIGDAFTAQWINEPASDTFRIMSTYMPPSAPGSLKQSEYLALMAFILRQNKYPAGSTPLTLAQLRSIKITSLRARER